MTGEKNIKQDIEALKKKAESVFRRHAAGNAAPAPAGRGTDAGGAGKIPKSGPGMEPGGGRADGRERPLRSGPLEEIVPGEKLDFGGGSFYRILTPAAAVWERADQVLAEYLDTLSAPFAPEAACIGRLAILGKVKPGEVCYLDIETTGLDNSPLFLVGLMYIDGGRILIDQLFARDYTEEETVLRYLSELLERFSVIVTFNGARFDIPFIADRMTVTGMTFMPPKDHLDLLPVARKFLGRRTPNHRLQTLERYVLGRKRIGDIPGSEIPGAYHEYVRTSDAGEVAEIIHHNRLDLLSMLELVTAFITQDQMN